VHLKLHLPRCVGSLGAAMHPHRPTVPPCAFSCSVARCGGGVGVRRNKGEAPVGERTGVEGDSNLGLCAKQSRKESKESGRRKTKFYFVSQRREREREYFWPIGARLASGPKRQTREVAPPGCNRVRGANTSLLTDLLLTQVISHNTL